MLLEKKSQMDRKVRNIYTVLSPVITPTSIRTKRKKKSARVKTSMIKN